MSKSLVFTGTRYGMTDKQKQSVREFLIQSKQFTTFYHGDCFGADEEFHEICRKWRGTHSGGPNIITYPVSGKWCANCVVSERFFRRARTNHLERNKEMVNVGDFVLGCPKEMKPQQRGGTWHTLRYSKKKNKDGVVILPNGELVDLKSIGL